jgi:predicted NBD/HSP70 family sugar kinase
LVSELKDLDLAYESQSAGPTGVGRPSVMVSLSTDVVAFAVNTTLDATTVEVVNLLGQVIMKARRSNPVNLTPTMAVQIANDLIIHMRANLSPGTRIIGVGVANLVNILNPEVVILSGFLGSLFKFDQDRLFEKFRHHTLVASQEEVTVIPGKLNANLLTVGAAELPIYKLLENPSFVSDMPIIKQRRRT